ncbi:conserved hypothetical protein [Desulfatibacillum aliphaticivorans]|uniref:DUF4956 domain-containing protein n=1 Tax=Desulfatibacillum aliphaticivorans TaxID=218208 RepID=B8FLX2_DESAL|nr:DUF4956 domain-containing protein [Desulfatibacillum aliphaticivorans]ACL05705.1 conserved hypothetical protein [Desulfatibacillum aliphaticivorans]
MFNSIDMNFFIRFVINSVTLYLLVKHCYYRRTPNRDFLFSFILFGAGVFIVSYILHCVQVSMGFAFGLFAIFSMLRYRTETISIKAMTYLFLVITVSLLSSVGQTSPIELILLNGLIVASAALAESRMLTPQLAEQIIRYEKIENITPQNRKNLLDDLRLRTGLDIQDVLIEKIDFLRDTAMLRVFYTAREHEEFPLESSSLQEEQSTRSTKP